MANHRLAAIMFTDIVGYTTIMANDEGKALSVLDRNRKFQQSLIKKFGGVFLKEMGDGILASFPSSTDAVICAAAIMERATQNNFNLRIGIHQGEVYFQNGDIFGSGVNIASRVEEITQPGQIYITQAVNNGVENKPGINTSFVYEKQLRNLKDTWKIFAVNVDLSQFTEVYAPVNPKKKKILSRKLSVKQLLLLFSTIAIAGLGIWKLQGDQAGLSADQAKSLQDKTVAVMIFENRTGEAELETLGKMVSDWMTRGLIESSDAKVVSASKVEQNYQLAAAGLTPSQDFSRATGADLLIDGRYYLQGEQLILHAQIINAKGGEVMFALEPLTGSRNEAIKLLDELTQQVLGFWMLGDRGKFNKKPPKYDAYQNYLKVSQYWQVDDDMSTSLLQKAFNADTTFYEALLKMTVLHINHQDYSKANALVQLIKNKNPKLSPWEVLRLQFLEARLSGNHQAVAQAHLNLWKMDPLGNAFNAGSSQLRDLNNPTKALEIWSSVFNEDYEYGNCFNCQWPFGRKMIAYHRLGQYDKVLAMSEKINFRLADYYIPMVQLWSLIRLDSLEAIPPLLDYYKTREDDFELYPGHFELIWQLGRESHLMGKVDLAGSYALELLQYLDDHPTEKYDAQYRQHAFLLLGRYEEGLQQVLRRDQKKSTLLTRGRIGTFQALLGQRQQAEASIQTIQQMDLPFDNGKKTYQEAIIRSALGQQDAAVKLLQQAYHEGLPFRWNYFKGDPYLQPLFEYPAFEAFVAPKSQ